MAAFLPPRSWSFIIDFISSSDIRFKASSPPGKSAKKSVVNAASNDEMVLASRSAMVFGDGDGYASRILDRDERISEGRFATV